MKPTPKNKMINNTDEIMATGIDMTIFKIPPNHTTIVYRMAENASIGMYFKFNPA